MKACPKCLGFGEKLTGGSICLECLNRMRDEHMANPEYWEGKACRSKRRCKKCKRREVHDGLCKDHLIEKLTAQVAC